MTLPPEWLVVDGYNIIGAWGDLNALARDDFGAARDRLALILASHCGYTGERLVLVFDAHQVRKTESVTPIFTGKGRHRRDVGEIVFTKRGETADNYIERFVRIHEGERMTVASGDALVQVLTFAYAVRLSAAELAVEVERSGKSMAERTRRKKRPLEERIGKNAAAELEALRRARPRHDER